MHTGIGATAVVVRGRELLLIRQRRGAETWWELPGGYLEAGESLDASAARETAEESGVPVLVGQIAFTLLWRDPRRERANVLVAFEATPIGTDWTLQPQHDENIDAAEFKDFDPLDVETVHPIYREPVRHWLANFPHEGPPPHFVCDISMTQDGRRDYRFTGPTMAR